MGDDKQQLRSCYARVMHKDRVNQLNEELDTEDRYELSSEMALYRETIVNLVQVIEDVRKKHPNRPDLFLALNSQLTDALDAMTRTFKHAQAIEQAGKVWNIQAVCNLIDKISAIIVYRVTEPRLRGIILEEITELVSIFRTDARVAGTTIMPDHDAKVMDLTVPAESEDMLCLEADNV